MGTSSRVLTFDGKRFCFQSDETNTAQNAGFRFDDESLRWVTRSIEKASQLRRHADISAEIKFKNHFITEFTPPEQIFYPDTLHPKLFQIESARHALTRSPAYIADDPGLGKTITSILCMNTIQGKTMVICPPFLKYNWADEIEKWCTRRHRQIDGQYIHIIETGTPERIHFAADIIILPDSLIDSPTIQHYMKDVKLEWLFIDEAHRYKTPDAKRTIALVGDKEDERVYFNYVNAAKRVVFLSGTPIPNGKPIELYPLLNQVAPEAIGYRTEIEYGIKFCGGKQVTRHEGRRAIAHWDFSGASNLKILRRELKKKLMIRHLKRDVLTELPPKTRKLVFLDAPKKLQAFEKKFLRERTLEEMLGSKPNLGDIARYQKEVGLSKLPQAVEYIKELLENSQDKIVVFAHHIEVVEGIARALVPFGSLMIRGGVSSKRKAGIVKLFQDEKEHRVIVGNIDAMGVGLTLTKSPLMVATEYSWVPGVNSQAEDRLHRMTQDRNVYIHYLVLRDTLDEKKLRSILRKEKNVDEVMG